MRSRLLSSRRRTEPFAQAPGAQRQTLCRGAQLQTLCANSKGRLKAVDVPAALSSLASAQGDFDSGDQCDAGRVVRTSIAIAEYRTLGQDPRSSQSPYRTERGESVPETLKLIYGRIFDERPFFQEFR
jgi:hypothetical protein